MKVTRVTKAVLRSRRKGRQRRAADQPQPQPPGALRGAQTTVRLEPPNVWPFPRWGSTR